MGISATPGMQCNHEPSENVIDLERCRSKGLPMLSGWMCGVWTVLMLGRRRHLRLIDVVSLLWGVCLKHDASLGRVGSERARISLAGMREVLRVLWTAHEEERVNSILLCLLTRHAQNACTRCYRRTLTNTQVAEVFPLAWAYQRWRGMRCTRSSSSANLNFWSRSKTQAMLRPRNGDQICSGVHGLLGSWTPVHYLAISDVVTYVNIIED